MRLSPDEGEAAIAKGGLPPGFARMGEKAAIQTPGAKLGSTLNHVNVMLLGVLRDPDHR